MNLIKRYPLDLTGVHPDNYIKDEVLQDRLVGGKWQPVVPVNAGAFYTDSVVLQNKPIGTPDTDPSLKKYQYGIDFKFVRLCEEATALSGKDTAMFIYFNKDKLYYDNKFGDRTVYCAYQCVGGEYQDNAAKVDGILTEYYNDPRGLYWEDIVDRPTHFWPHRHLHDIHDTYGWAELHGSINLLTRTMAVGFQRDNIPLYQRLAKVEQALNINDGDSTSVTILTRDQYDDVINLIANQPYLSSKEFSDGITEIKGTISTLRDKDTALDGEITALKAKDNATDARIDKTDNNIKGLQTQLQALASITPVHSIRYDRRSASREDWLDITDNGRNGMELVVYNDTRIDDINTKLRGHDSAISTINSKNDELDQRITANQNAIAGNVSAIESVKESQTALRELTNTNTIAITTNTNAIKSVKDESAEVKEALNQYRTTNDNRVEQLSQSVSAATGDVGSKLAALESKLSQKIDDTESDLNSKVAGLETKLSTAEENAANNLTDVKNALDDKITTNANNITALERKVDSNHDTLVSRIDDADNAITTNQQAIEAAKTNLTDTINTKVEELTQADSAIATRIDSIETSVTPLTQKVDQLEQDITDGQSATNTRINNVEQTLTQANQTLSTQVDNKIDTLESRVDSGLSDINDKIDDLKTKVMTKILPIDIDLSRERAGVGVSYYTNEYNKEHIAIIDHDKWEESNQRNDGEYIGLFHINDIREDSRISGILTKVYQGSITDIETDDDELNRLKAQWDEDGEGNYLLTYLVPHYNDHYYNNYKNNTILNRGLVGKLLGEDHDIINKMRRDITLGYDYALGHPGNNPMQVVIMVIRRDKAGHVTLVSYEHYADGDRQRDYQHNLNMMIYPKRYADTSGDYVCLSRDRDMESIDQRDIQLNNRIMQTDAGYNYLTNAEMKYEGDDIPGWQTYEYISERGTENHHVRSIASTGLNNFTLLPGQADVLKYGVKMMNQENSTTSRRYVINQTVFSHLSRARNKLEVSFSLRQADMDAGAPRRLNVIYGWLGCDNQGVPIGYNEQGFSTSSVITNSTDLTDDEDILGHRHDLNQMRRYKFVIDTTPDDDNQHYRFFFNVMGSRQNGMQEMIVSHVTLSYRRHGYAFIPGQPVFSGEVIQKVLADKINEVKGTLGSDAESLKTELTSAIDAVKQDVTSGYQGADTTLSEKIDTSIGTINQKITSVENTIEELKNIKPSIILPISVNVEDGIGPSIVLSYVDKDGQPEKLPLMNNDKWPYFNFKHGFGYAEILDYDNQESIEDLVKVKPFFNIEDDGGPMGSEEHKQAMDEIVAEVNRNYLFMIITNISEDLYRDKYSYYHDPNRNSVSNNTIIDKLFGHTESISRRIMASLNEAYEYHRSTGISDGTKQVILMSLHLNEQGEWVMSGYEHFYHRLDKEYPNNIHLAIYPKVYNGEAHGDMVVLDRTMDNVSHDTHLSLKLMKMLQDDNAYNFIDNPEMAHADGHVPGWQEYYVEGKNVVAKTFIVKEIDTTNVPSAPDGSKRGAIINADSLDPQDANIGGYINKRVYHQLNQPLEITFDYQQLDGKRYSDTLVGSMPYLQYAFVHCKEDGTLLREDGTDSLSSRIKNGTLVYTSITSVSTVDNSPVGPGITRRYKALLMPSFNAQYTRLLIAYRSGPGKEGLISNITLTYPRKAYHFNPPLPTVTEATMKGAISTAVEEFNRTNSSLKEDITTAYTAAIASASQAQSTALTSGLSNIESTLTSKINEISDQTSGSTALSGKVDALTSTVDELDAYPGSRRLALTAEKSSSATPYVKIMVSALDKDKQPLTYQLLNTNQPDDLNIFRFDEANIDNTNYISRITNLAWSEKNVSAVQSAISVSEDHAFLITVDLTPESVLYDDSSLARLLPSSRLIKPAIDKAILHIKLDPLYRQRIALLITVIRDKRNQLIPTGWMIATAHDQSAQVGYIDIKKDFYGKGSPLVHLINTGIDYPGFDYRLDVDGLYDNGYNFLVNPELNVKSKQMSGWLLYRKPDRYRDNIYKIDDQDVISNRTDVLVDGRVTWHQQGIMPGKMGEEDVWVNECHCPIASTKFEVSYDVWVCSNRSISEEDIVNELPSFGITNTVNKYSKVDRSSTTFTTAKIDPISKGVVRVKITNTTPVGGEVGRDHIHLTMMRNKKAKGRNDIIITNLTFTFERIRRTYTPPAATVDVSDIKSKLTDTIQTAVNKYIVDNTRDTTASRWDLSRFVKQPGAEDWSEVETDSQDNLVVKGVILQQMNGSSSSVFAPDTTIQVTSNQQWTVPSRLVGRKAEIIVRAASLQDNGNYITSAVRKTYVVLPEGRINIIVGPITSFGNYLTVSNGQEYMDAISPRTVSANRYNQPGLVMINV